MQKKYYPYRVLPRENIVSIFNRKLLLIKKKFKAVNYPIKFIESVIKTLRQKHKLKKNIL